jgi:uncharacterized membrane protein YfcA
VVIDPLYPLSGFVVGVLVGQTGVGGGSLMTPLLVLLFGVHPSTAVGTDLLFAAATKTVGTAMHGRHGTVDWRITLWLAAGSVPTTMLMLLLLAQTDVLTPGVARVFAVTLSAALILSGIGLLMRDPVRVLGRFASADRSPRRTRLLTAMAGAALGVLVPLSSVGAGAIGITILILLYPDRRLVTLVGSDIAHAVPLTLLAGLGHWAVGSVDFPLLASLLTGSIPGVMLGSALSGRIPQRVLRPVLALLLLAVGVKVAVSLIG